MRGRNRITLNQAVDPQALYWQALKEFPDVPVTRARLRRLQRRVRRLIESGRV